jgi:hypothetical protein
MNFRDVCNQLLVESERALHGIDAELGPWKTDINFPGFRTAIANTRAAMMLDPEKPQHSPERKAILCPECRNMTSQCQLCFGAGWVYDNEDS